MRIHSYEKEFRLQFHFHASQSHFHKKGSALRLALKQRHKGPRKCPIVTTSELLNNIVIQLIICWLRIHGVIYSQATGAGSGFFLWGATPQRNGVTD